MKCANCSKDAQYVYRITMDYSILYCVEHLPSFLEPRLKAGLLEKTDAYKEAISSGIESILAKEAAVKPPAEEPTVVEETKPAKARTKKAASKNAPNS